jgi:hypothetical protein
MNFCQNKSRFLNLFAIVSLTVTMGYLVISDNFSAESEQVQFVNLTNADIDKILAVKAEMQAAKIQANLSL